jgi:plastocyanin domain-containing protein
MLSKKIIFSNLVGLGFLLGISSGVAANQMSMEMPHSTTEKNVQFRKIEQPLGLKMGVTLGGLGLIGLELWWFMFSKTKAKKAEATQGIQEMTITVDGGYEPSRVVVQAGQPVRLNFFRRDPSSCLEKVLIPDFQIAKDLDLNHVTPIEFTPKKPGQYPFTCGMNMFRGVVEVQPVGTSQKI